MAKQEGIRVAKAYMDITTNIDEAMAETNRKVRAAARDIERGAGTVGASIDQGVADGITRGQETKKAAGKAGEDAGDEFNKRAGKKIDGGKDVDSAVEKVAQRAESKFSAIQFVGLFAGLPALSAAAGVGVAAGLAVIPLAFAGLAFAGLASSQNVGNAMTAMGDHVQDSVKKMSQPLEGTMVTAINRLSTGFDRIEPQVRKAMAGSAESVLIFEDGLIGAAQNAMPGFVAAVEHSKAPMLGMQSLLLSTGSGVGDMFKNMTNGAASSQGIMQTTGFIVRDLLGFVGSLFANLSNQGGPALLNFRQALSTVENTLLSATSAGAPLIGVLTGFTGGVSGALSVLSAFVSLLNLLPPGMSQAAGTMLAAIKILDMFGVSAKNSFAGFGASIGAADGARGKFQAGMSGLIAGAMSPAGLAVGALSIGLMLLGDAQQKAAAEAQKHDSYLQSLTGALRQSNGEIDNNVRAQAVQSLSNTKVADSGTSVLAWAKSMHISLPMVTDAALGVPGAMDQVNSAIDTYKTSSGGSAQVAETFRSALGNMASAAPQATAAIQAEATAHGAANTSIRAQLTAMLALNDALLATADKELAYAQAQTGLTAAHNAVTEALKAHKQGSLEVTQAQQGEEGAMLTLIKASQAKATADYKGTDATEGQMRGMKAAAIEALNLAGQYGGKLPSSVYNYVTSLSAAQLAAAGVTVSIDNVGNAVYRLPNGKVVKIESTAEQQIQKVAALAAQINALHDKQVMITVSQRGTANAVSQTGRPTWSAKGNLFPANVGFADGGFPVATTANNIGSMATVVKPGDYKWSGDAKVDELYLPLDHSARSMDLLAAANKLMPAAAGQAAASGGSVGGGSVATDREQRVVYVTQHIYTLPNQSSRDVATQATAELTWQLRT